MDRREFLQGGLALIVNSSVSAGCALHSTNLIPKKVARLELPGGKVPLWEKTIENGETIKVYKRLGEPGRVEIHNVYRMLSDDWTSVYVDYNGDGYPDLFYSLNGRGQIFELNWIATPLSNTDESGLDYYLKIIEKEGGPKLK